MFAIHFLRRGVPPVVTWAALFCCAAHGAALQTALWKGGTGAWASDHWGLSEGFPGDAHHADVQTQISSQDAVVGIDAGTSLELTAVALVSAGEVRQTGGSAAFVRRLDVRGRYVLSEGEVTGSSFRVSQGGEIAIFGGEFLGTNGEFRFQQRSGLLHIAGGRFEMRNIFLGDTDTSEAVIRVSGKTATMTVTSFHLKNSGGSSTAEFVFDKSGISPWKVLGGAGSLNLGENDTRADLMVHVGACPSDGREGFSLFNYSSAAGGLVGVFGEITILHGQKKFAPGDRNSLRPGEYFLEMAGGDGTEILLFFNNTGLPLEKPHPPGRN